MLEIWRILRPEGLIFATVPASKNQAHGFRQIEENTFVPLDGREKGIAHHYFDKKGIIELLEGFNVWDIHVDSKNHFCFLGERPSDSHGDSLGKVE